MGVSEEILEDLCLQNGISIHDMKNNPEKYGAKVHYLESFFNGLPHIMNMEKFPFLSELKIIGQELKSMNGLEPLVALTELWIVECQIKKITSLENCKKIRKLFLYSNKISVIENLEELNLTVLWLDGNQISKIEGLSHMNNLSELNLAKNNIKYIGDSLKNLENLARLNLASNLIDNFNDITNLQGLINLKHLCLKDPQYGYNPVTMLCNYSLYVIYHLPNLSTLDTLTISLKIVKELADSTINKKKLWYFMRLNTINRQMNEMIEKINLIKNTQSQPLKDQINALISKILEIKYEKTTETYEQSKSDENEDLLIALNDRLIEIKNKLKLIDVQYEQCLDHIVQEIEVKKRYVFIELENGGNIKFEFSNFNDSWYKSCHELVLSRFCAADYVTRSISGIKIRKVIRVTNRLLLSKYEEHILNDIDEFDYINNKPSLRKKVDYLLYCWRPKFGDHFTELFDIIKFGFKEPSEYKKHGYEAAIPFSNSMSLCDHERIESMKESNPNRTNNMAFKHGYVILCKVFTSKFSQCQAMEIKSENYPDYYGVCRKFRNDQSKLAKISTTQEYLQNQRNCECKGRTAEFFLFNKFLAVPEYIIEFEYVNKPGFDNVFDAELQKVKTNLRESKLEASSQNDLVNKFINEKLKNESETKLSPLKNSEIVNNKIEIQTAKLNEARANANNLTELNLHNSGLTDLDVESFKCLTQLKKLILSFNKLKLIKDIANLTNLDYLDVSYNQIESITGYKTVSRIHYLDLTQNKLSDIIPILNNLKQFFPIINHINLTDNPFKRYTKLKALLIYSIKSLTCFNGEEIDGEEKEFPDSIYKLNKVLIKRNCHFIQNRPRNLRYCFVADLFNDKEGINEEKFDLITSMPQYTDHSSSIYHDLENQLNDLYSQITTINLDNQSLYKLDNISYLANLKWASFNNNYILNIDGFDKCVKLEELSLENNLIYSLTGLEQLVNLRKLNVSNNEIVYFDDSLIRIDYGTKNWDINLTRLTYLNISNNKLTSLRFISKLPSLVEFYCSFNQLKNIRDVFHLKCLPSLAILDLWCNPMCADQKYRLFVIYHLKLLKSIDGSTIEANELTEAKDLFGGKLTCDFIAEKFFHSKFNEIKMLEFPQSGIRIVDLGHTVNLNLDQFDNLRSLNLENNNLTSFSGILYLRNLKVLCLNNNKIECIFPKSKTNTNQVLSTGLDYLLPTLEVLYLAYNGISDLVSAQIGKLTSLKALFLQGNEIVKIEGLETLRDLRELVLDKNKIKHIGELSFAGQMMRLSELHIEENRLKDLNNLHICRGLHKLYAANNKISEFFEIERLIELNHLLEISLINNPLSRRPHYRITIVYRLRRVKVLDMVEVNEEDKIKAEIYFNEQQQILNQPQIYYNGIFTQPVQAEANSQSNNNRNTNAPTATEYHNGNNSNNLHSMSQSPRLKPITIIDKQYGNNQSNFNNQNSRNENSKLKSKNAYEKIARDNQTRYRSQH